MQPVAFITSEMYMNGSRIDSAKAITFNPFYHAGFDRVKAVSYVQMFNEPVLRPSSIPTRFAMTFKNTFGGVSHVLIRQNADLSIDEMTEVGTMHRHYANIFELLDRALGHFDAMEYESPHQPLPRLPVPPAPIEPLAEPIASAAAGGAGTRVPPAPSAVSSPASSPWPSNEDSYDSPATTL